MKTASRFSIGTTSACAENTKAGFRCRWFGRNYLRVRGEYLKTAWDEVMSAELPPRARRIHLAAAADAVVKGTTSACAENTRAYPTIAAAGRNYLRVRGEYVCG